MRVAAAREGGYPASSIRLHTVAEHLEAALRAGLACRGIPRVVYLDNGSAMVSTQLLRSLAILGIQLTHSRPGQPAGRGKIERFFRTVREQFLVELAAPGALAKIDTLTELNELFTAWVESVYHQRVHSETGQTPLARFTATDPPALPSPAVLHEAFLWSERRTVTKTATVSLHGNTYEVDAALVGRRVELVFDPFDLTCLSVRYQEPDMAAAIHHTQREREQPRPSGGTWLSVPSHASQQGRSRSQRTGPHDGPEALPTEGTIMPTDTLPARTLVGRLILALADNDF